VAVRLRLWGRDVCFVNSHLAAHMDGVPKRNDDWRRIYGGLFAGAGPGPRARRAGAGGRRSPWPPSPRLREVCTRVEISRTSHMF